jgi:opacity protein-like surface antigen
MLKIIYKENVMKKLTLSIAAIAAMSTFAMAGGDIAPVEPVVETPVVTPVTDAGFYLGLGYSWIGQDIEGLSSTDYSAIMLQAGYKINPYVAVEGRYWTNVNDDSISFRGANTSVDIGSDAWGIYVKPMYPVTDTFDVYALLGYGSASADNITLNGGGTYTLPDMDGFSWGVGAAYEFTNNWSVFLDYVAFDDSTWDNSLKKLSGDQTFETINLGVTYKF